MKLLAFAKKLYLNKALQQHKGITFNNYNGNRVL